MSDGCLWQYKLRKLFCAVVIHEYLVITLQGILNIYPWHKPCFFLWMENLIMWIPNQLYPWTGIDARYIIFSYTMDLIIDNFMVKSEFLYTCYYLLVISNIIYSLFIVFLSLTWTKTYTQFPWTTFQCLYKQISINIYDPHIGRSWNLLE